MLKPFQWGMVLAAGFGKRMMPLTATLHKSLIPIAGLIPLDYAIQNLIDVGVTNIVVNGHYRASDVETHLAKNWQIPNINIHFLYEDEILETGGGIMNAMKKFDIQELIVSNADVLLIDKNKPALSSLVANWQSNKMQLLMMVQNHKKTLQNIEKGDFFILDNGHFTFDSNNRGDFIFLGTYIVNRSLFNDRNKVSSFSMLEYIMLSTPEEYSKHQYFTVNYNSHFLNIGTIPLMESAKSLLNDKSLDI